MPTQFGIPDLIVTRGTANAPSRRPSQQSNVKMNIKPLHVAPSMGYNQRRGGWSSQGGYNGMSYDIQPTPPVLYENPLAGSGEGTLIPNHSLKGKTKGVIRLSDEQYSEIKMTPNVKHPIYNIPTFDALKLYQ